MRILLAPDKFRGTFTAAEVCAQLTRALLDGTHGVVVESLPLADGGEGTLDAVQRAAGGTRVPIEARGPLDEEIGSEYLVTPGGVAVIESAKLCGLDLVDPGERDPMLASSYGLGQCVAAALEAGSRRITIGLGGTATLDGGIGMARALGYRFEDASGGEKGGRGKDLEGIERIDASLCHPALSETRVTALCDVDNPLLGAGGAARVFGPQKGASPADLEKLERGLGMLCAAIARWKGWDAGETSLLPGGGAAGGLGLGCRAFLGASLQPGAARIMESLRFAEKLRWADLVVTGEGSFDAKTAGGKVVAAVLHAAQEARKPVIVVAGQWDGAWPAGGSGGPQVLTGQNLPDRPSRLGSSDLVALGRQILSRVSELARTSGAEKPARS